MYEYKSNRLDISINDMDIYGTGLYSATGKSYLCTLLSVYRQEMKKNNINCRTFKDSEDYEDFVNKYLNIPIGTLVVLDRLDFYFSKEWLDTLKSRRNELYTVVDFKRNNYNYIVRRYININIENERVTVNV